MNRAEVDGTEQVKAERTRVGRMSTTQGRLRQRDALGANIRRGEESR